MRSAMFQSVSCSALRRITARALCTLKDEGACLTAVETISRMRESGIGDSLESS